jgi:Derlin-2/3
MPPQVNRVGGGDSPQDWFYSLPPVTRSLFVGVLALTCGSSFGIINPANLALLWEPIIYKFEIWRLGSDFIYYGGFSFNFLIQLYLLVQYSSRYEVSPFNTGAGGTSADFAWMLCIGVALLSLLGFIFQLVFMGQSLSFMILYVWTRKNPDEQTSIFGFKVQAFYLPWALLAFNLLIGNPIFKLVLGIVAGHIYYFLHYVAPNVYGMTIIKTPAFMVESFGGIPQPLQAGRAAGGQPRPQAGHNWGGGNVLGAN